MSFLSEFQLTAAQQWQEIRGNRLQAGAWTIFRAHKLELWIVAVTMIAASFAALVHLRTSSIWYDEAITMLTTSAHAQLDWTLGLQQFKPSANLVKITRELYEQDVHPPLYFWTLALWRVAFGESLEVARALSALFTLGTLWLLYRLGREFEMKWPWVPTVMYAASAVGLRYAYNARPYAMASFLILLTLYLARRKSNWTGVCAVACIATHYFAAMCVGPILLSEAVLQWRRNRRWVLLTMASFVACCAPLIPLLRVHLFARPMQYPGFGPFRLEAWRLLKGAMEGVMPATWLPRWGFALLLGTAFALIGSWRQLRRKEWLIPCVYGLFLLAFLLLAVATNKSILKMPADYYTGIAATFLALLIGFGVSAAPRASLALAVVLIAGTLTPVPMTKTTDYRGILGRVRADCSNCSILVGVGYAGAIPACVLYEAKGMNVVLLKADDTVPKALERMGDPGTFILIPGNEPATRDLEQQIVQTYPSAWKDGYYDVAVQESRAR